MNTVQLTSLARSCPTSNSYFRGVYALDTIPSSLCEPSTYICNLDTSDKPGSHWVSFYVPPLRTEPVEYFDSYGLQAPSDIERRFLSGRPCSYYLYNNRMLQSLSSAVCGQYALYFIWQRPIQLDMDRVLNIFDSDIHLYNDLIVNSLVKVHFKVDLDVYYRCI